MFAIAITTARQAKLKSSIQRGDLSQNGYGCDKRMGQDEACSMQNPRLPYNEQRLAPTSQKGDAAAAKCDVSNTTIAAPHHMERHTANEVAIQFKKVLPP